MSKRKRLDGVGVVTFVLMLLVIVTSCMAVFRQYGVQVRTTVANLSQELAGDTEGVATCNPGADDVYDPRAQRYRNQTTGRFTRPPGC